MQNQIILFIQQLNTQKKYAKNTITSYKADLKQWLIFSHNKGIKSWQDLDKERVQLYLMILKNKSISVATMRRRLSALRLFYQYLMQKNLIKANPTNHIKTPKLPQLLPKIISIKEVEQLLKPKHNANTLNQCRNTAIIVLFYTCAIRLSELVGLDIADIDFNSGFIKVLGKGNKQRYTPIGKQGIAQIKNYLDSRLNLGNQALFLSNRNTRISARMVQKIVENYAKINQLGQHLHPHMLRHASATHFLQRSHNLRIVQEFLGHDSIKSTQRYTHLDYQALAQVYNQCHPRSQNKNKTDDNTT